MDHYQLNTLSNQTFRAFYFPSPTNITISFECSSFRTFLKRLISDDSLDFWLSMKARSRLFDSKGLCHSKKLLFFAKSCFWMSWNPQLTRPADVSDWGTEIWMWWCWESRAMPHYCPYSMALARVWLVPHHLWLATAAAAIGLCSDENASPKTARWSSSRSRFLQQRYNGRATVLQLCLLLYEDALQLDELLFHSVNEALLPAPGTRGELWWPTPSMHLHFQPATIFIANDIDVTQVALIKPKWQLGPSWWPLATCL